MYELEKIGEKTYYIKSPNNVGIYKINDQEVYLIDAGNDKDAGKKILKIVQEQGWNVKGIINTHSNADHVGGDKVIQERTQCGILAHGIEKVITQYPILEPAFLYSGFPFQDLRNKFLMAKAPEKVKELEENLPEGLEVLHLPGHFFDMIGIKTDDNVYFLADSLFSKETIEKYHIFFIYDVESFLKTLDMLETLEGKIYVPCHNESLTDLHELVAINRKKIYEICDTIIDILKVPMTFEKLLKEIFDRYSLIMNTNQYVLVGSTVRSYLAYLKDKNQVCFEIVENEMIWKNNIKNSN